MADPITVVHAIYILVREFNLTVQKARCSKRRLRHLLDRVSWFADKFAEIEKTRALKDTDMKVINDFKQLLEEIVQFTSSLNQDGWMGRMWKANSNDDAIDDFNVRLEAARNDLIFIFTTDTPLPKAWEKGDEEDWYELLQLVKGATAHQVEEEIEKELALARLNREEIIQRLQRKFNESVTKSESYDWQENILATSFGSVLKAADFRPDLHKLSKDRFPTLVIGEGTFGTVFKCQWRGDIVAVKILKLQTLSKRALSQLSEEVRIMYSLGAHKNVINIYGLVVDPGRCLCLVMNFASRGSLRHNLDLQVNQAPTPHEGALAEELWKIRWRWAYEIASGMAWLHSASPPIIHRDLKSDNILMDEDGRLLVSDFGCAIAKSETISRTTGAETVAAGSIPWMPPEAFSQHGKQGAEGDVYAYAVVLWEILTRDIPWCGVHPSLIPALVQGGQRPIIPEPVLAKAHPEFVSLIRMCWDQTPSSRPPFAFVKSKLANMFSLATPTPSGAGSLSFRLRHSQSSHHLLRATSSSQRFSPRFVLTTPRSLVVSPRLITPTPNRIAIYSNGENGSISTTPQSTASFSFETLGAQVKSPTNKALVSPPARRPPVNQSPPIILENTGIPGVCEWLRKSSAPDLAEMTILPTDLIQTKQLLEAIVRSDPNKVEELATLLNEYRDDEGGVHLVAGAIKEYFRSLAEPITTFALYPTLLQLGQTHLENDDALAKDIGDVFTRIPEPRFTEFRSLLKFLNSIRTVSIDQLAEVWAPHLVWTQTKSKDYMFHLSVVARVVYVAIDKYQTVFELTHSLASTFSSNQQQLQILREQMASKGGSQKKRMSSMLSSGDKSSKDLQSSSRRLLMQSSSTASANSTSGSFRKMLSKPFSSGLNGFVRVFPPVGTSTTVPEETATEIAKENDDCGFAGIDPVSKVKLKHDEVYARDGDICFQSMATQNFFYKMLETGFQFENGNFIEGTKKDRVWTLQSDKGQFGVLGGGSTGLSQTGSSMSNNLQVSIDVKDEGKYTFEATISEVKEKRLFSANKCKGVVALFQVISSGTDIEQTEFPMNPQNPQETKVRFPFQVTRAQCPCVIKVSFISRHRRRKFIINASLDRASPPQHMLEVEKARKASQAMLQPDEFLVEFEKDAFGLGVSVTWDENQQAIVVKAIEPGGAAARSGKVNKGDIIRAVQGHRVDLLDHHEVGQMLRDIPLTVVLILKQPSRRAYSLTSFPSSNASSHAASSRSLLTPARSHRYSME